MPQPANAAATGAAGDGPNRFDEQGAMLAPDAGRTNGSGEHAVGELSLYELHDALQAMRVGNFSVRLPSHHTGITGKVADAFNDIVAANAGTERVVAGRWLPGSHMRSRSEGQAGRAGAVAPYPPALTSASY